MTTAVQPIRYTTDPLAWHALARALGLVPMPGGTDDWTEFAGSGVLAIHAVASPTDVRTEVDLLTDDLDGLERALGDAARRITAAGVGPLLVVDGPPAFTATQLRAEHLSSPSPLRVLPIWYDAPPVLEAAGHLLRRTPLARRLASDSGGWVDYAADGGGLVALHASEARTDVELSFEYAGPLEELGQRLSHAGYEPVVVDEAYNRTLRVPTPEGADLWVNGVMEDTYGYSRG